jgi:hypothetical protein
MPAQALQDPVLHRFQLATMWPAPGRHPRTADQGRQQAVDSIARLERQRRIRAVVVRVFLALLRASGSPSLASGCAKVGSRQPCCDSSDLAIETCEPRR